jgi:hypothetical protein
MVDVLISSWEMVNRCITILMVDELMKADTSLVVGLPINKTRKPKPLETM